MNLKFAIGAALAAGAFMAMPVIAQDQGFTRLDKNSDGNIDQTEAAAWPWLQQNFSQYDHDHDGKLGKDEFAEAVNAARTARGGAPGATGYAGRGFDSLDPNHDGNIDQTEAAAWPWLQQNFSQYDHDRDGKLGKDEFAEAVNGARAANVFPGAGATRDPSGAFDTLDKNHDGSIDKTEAVAWPRLQQGFDTYDTNHDGKLGKDEFGSAVSALRAARGAAGGTTAASSAYAQFDTLDKNNDGKLDPSEVASMPWLQQSFSQYDTNHDGTLGKDEFSAAVSAHGPQ